MESKRLTSHIFGSTWQGWLFWLIAAVFYGYEFTHRVAPMVMIPQLMQSFDVSRAQLGDLASFYFYGYALIQVPAGMLVDRFGVRVILTFGCLIIALGSFCLNATSFLAFACLSRFIIGVGSAFAFVSCLKILSEHFQPKLFPLMVGLTNLFGICGAILGGAPLAKLLYLLKWQEVYLVLGLMAMGLAATIWLVIRDPSGVCKTYKPGVDNKIWQGLTEVIKQPQTWFLSFYAMLIVAPITAFAEMWGVEFFETSYNLVVEQAAGFLKYIFYGIAIGGPTIGWLGSRLNKLQPWFWLCSILALTALSSTIFIKFENLSHLKLLLFLYGFASSHMLLCFSIANQFYPEWAKATAIGFINMMIMGGSAIFQPLIGKLLDLSLSAKGYSLDSQVGYQQYSAALAVLPFCVLFAMSLLLFIKERQTTSL